MGLAFDQTTDTRDSVDLVALGRTWTPPQDIDTSPEVSDVIAKMPWWATRGVLYIIVTFIIVAVVWASLSKVDVVAEGRGTLVPEGYVKPVQAAGSGVVQNVFVKEGDTVARGQALVQLAASEIRTRLSKLSEELETSQSQLRQLMVNRPVAETLEQQNRIARLQSEIAAAELTMQHTTLTAPVSGVITTLGVRGSGEVLQPGQTVATIAPTGVHLVVEAQMPNKDIAFIEKGAKCDCHFRLGSRHNLIRNTDGLIVKGAGSEVGMKRNGGPYEVDVIRRIGIDRGVGYVRIPQTGGLKRYKPI